MNKLSSILFEGQEYEVKIIAYPGKSSKIFLKDYRFDIYVNSKLGTRITEEAACQLKLWMLEMAEKQIRQRTKEYSNIIGVSYHNIRIKDTKSRWGSCSSKGNLNFNFRIAMSPPAVMDYIIVHELCHLLHMNHSKEFWDAVARYMPEYEKHKEWLKKNGAKLYII